jgi:hypothetical protein
MPRFVEHGAPFSGGTAQRRAIFRRSRNIFSGRTAKHETAKWPRCGIQPQTIFDTKSLHAKKRALFRSDDQPKSSRCQLAKKGGKHLIT